MSALEAVGQFLAFALLAVVLILNDTGIAQGDIIGGEACLATPDDFLRVNSRYPLDDRGIFKFHLACVVIALTEIYANVQSAFANSFSI